MNTNQVCNLIADGLVSAKKRSERIEVQDALIFLAGYFSAELCKEDPEAVNVLMRAVGVGKNALHGRDVTTYRYGSALRLNQQTALRSLS